MNDSDHDFVHLLLTAIFIVLVLQLLSGCAPTQAASPADCGNAVKIAGQVIDILSAACVEGEAVPLKVDGIDMAIICRPTTPI
jgi:hypothetical protein